MKWWLIVGLYVHVVFGAAWFFDLSPVAVVLALMVGIGLVMLLLPGRPPVGYCGKCEEPVTECKCWLRDGN